MFETHNPTIQALLIQTGVAAVALEAADLEQQATGRAWADVAIDLGLITRERLLGLVAAHLGSEYLERAPASLSPDVRALMPAELARTYGVIPLRAEGSRLDLLAVDPLNARIVEDLTFALGHDLRLIVADPLQVEALIRQHYGEDEASADQLLREIHAEEYQTPDTALSVTEIEQLAGQTPIIRFVNLVLGQAIRDQASDIHFEPFEHEFKIRYRIDGTLYEMTPPARQLALPITSRLKVLANLNIAERRVPQDGRIRITLAGRPVDLRVSTLPTQFGESVVLRVLDQAADQLDLAQLGLPAEVRAGLEEMVRRPNGIFIATGPTGSGKTTTLYSGLRLINRPELKLLTAEDPVEYDIEGIMQVPVNAAIGLTFATALRAFLRQDPDVIMVGEIRDLETAQVAIQASLTGHLVLSTLHTNDAVGTVIRLMDMGVEPFLITSTLEAVLAQRLVRRICRHCREPATGTSDSQTFFHGRGCGHCNHTGYLGRLGLFEWLRMTEPMRELVLQKAPAQQLRQLAARQGMRTLREDGLRNVLAGETTMAEVNKYT